MSEATSGKQPDETPISLRSSGLRLLKFRSPNGWNEAEPDEGMLTRIALSDCLGKTARTEVAAKIDARVRAAFGGDE
jgi:hypothetical protein